jgi:thiol:disulfide interchange protein DsbA
MLKLATILFGLFLATSASAQQAYPPAQRQAAPRVLVAGRDFLVLSQKLPTTPGRIDVIYFFWYGSPWSASFDPLIRKWAAEKAPAVARFQPAPAVITEGWGYGARVFYALEAMHIERTVGPALIAAIHSGVVKYDTPKSLQDWLRTNNVDIKAFTAAINSPLVVAETASSPQISKIFGVNSVPTVVVDGQFLFVIGPSGDVNELLSRVSYAVEALAQKALTQKNLKK